MPALSGLDLLEEKWPQSLRGAGVGCCPSCFRKRAVEHAVPVFQRSRRFQLKALFGPHMASGETQDNMIEWQGFRDPRTGLPVYSLYSDTRKPTRGCWRI
jgi:uncharacterized protein YbbC (DUF1343 family)